ncbi:MAG: 4-hydroxy-3-methylbut-2-enyl diphosphate reductase [Bacteroidales bacterium]|nr:4-hydroxy-3-methylbut-2-enyl diphosphate reductase [Bacteroidales bacterium]
MPHSVEIDEKSGFCGGVIHAIETAERLLRTQPRIYSLGDVVHNEAELSRLREEGLVTIDHDDLSQISNASSETLLIRAHGEPPETYRKIARAGFKVADCTCPVVLGLQKKIRDTYNEKAASGGQIVIFGKRGHAEVLGLVGQVDDDACVVENESQLQTLVDNGTLDVHRAIDIFSQTTMSSEGYSSLCAFLRTLLKEGGSLTVHDTICRQVALRHSNLRDFARSHDIIIFVAGCTSSNGKVLSDICRSVNIRTFNVGSAQEVRPHWFRSDDNVGVCGATSTPKWLLEQVASCIEIL